MARRMMRAFTLSAEVSQNLDDLTVAVSKDEELRTLLFASEAPLDRYRLAPEDYAYLYTLLPPQTPNAKVGRALNFNVFNIHLSACAELHPDLSARAVREMNARIQANKPPPMNASRVADALLRRAMADVYAREDRHEGSAPPKPSQRTPRLATTPPLVALTEPAAKDHEK